MSFLDPFQIEELARLASLSDREVRSDLAIGAIKDENDYTSNFTGAFRRNINSYSRSGLIATSFLLPHAEEREVGADAAIILTRGNESKVAVFEAKWPRFSKRGYAWDYDQTATGLSHFSDQLERQKRWQKTVAVFEMFYAEHRFGKQPPYLNGNGSSCIWHADAEAFRMGRQDPDAVWTQGELQKLLLTKSISIGDVMMEFGRCNQGSSIPMTEPLKIGREFRLHSELLAIKADGDRFRRRPR
jgi:hypothetical protein